MGDGAKLARNFLWRCSIKVSQHDDRDFRLGVIGEQRIEAFDAAAMVDARDERLHDLIHSRNVLRETRNSHQQREHNRAHHKGHLFGDSIAGGTITHMIHLLTLMVVVGLSQSGARIEATEIRGPSPSAPTVLIIGGLSGLDESVHDVQGELRRRHGNFRVLAIPLANPDGSKLVFPPAGIAYRENPESHALWRWIGIHAPDLVMIVGKDEFGLAEALANNVVAGIGRIPAQRGMAMPKTVQPSEAHREIERRRNRTPQQVAEEFAKIYGQDFDLPTYVFGMALIGRMRLGQVADVERLAEPYVNGSKDSLARATSPHLSGHLVFAELAELTGDPRYIQAARRAADLGFSATGEMKESMPLHDEMSDSVFMGIPILAKTGKLTGDRKYFDMAARHLRFMQKLDLRPDGLYRHSPLSDAAWGRGNAFPALGLALTLSDFPKDHPEFPRILRSFREHMAALARFQDEEGLWHQVIDYPGAYAEFTATAMIGISMLRGIRNGFLDAKTYRPRVDKAWRAILTRVGSDGQLIDVCESTGKQKSLEDYLRRAAILGRDPRGGAMALLFATETQSLKPW